MNSLSISTAKKIDLVQFLKSKTGEFLKENSRWCAMNPSLIDINGRQKYSVLSDIQINVVVLITESGM